MENLGFLISSLPNLPPKLKSYRPSLKFNKISVLASSQSNSFCYPIMTTTEQNREIQETVQSERKRLLDFIRRRVPSSDDADDVLQEVFYELVEMYRLTKPVEQMVSWLYMVARNKINDLYRGKKTVTLDYQQFINDEEEKISFFDMLPDNSNADPMMQEMILEALSQALQELPADQRLVFELHELEEKSFKEIAEITGVNMNTLLSKKRQAVQYLRERLRYLYQEVFN
jgi:RNA polymerase sigma factor (sigma-70 family)